MNATATKIRPTTETRYFGRFDTFFDKNLFISAEIRTIFSGQLKLSVDYAPLARLADDYHDTPDAFENGLLYFGFVELPKKAYDVATSTPWHLYAYKQYVTSDDYLKGLRLNYAGVDGEPEVWDTNPASAEAQAILDTAVEATLNLSNNLIGNKLIFPQFGNVVAGQTDCKRLLPLWNAVACEGREMPYHIDASELPQYAPFMAHMGVNSSGRVVSYYDSDLDD